MFGDIWKTDEVVEEKMEEVAPTTAPNKTKKARKIPLPVPKGSGATRPSRTRPALPPATIAHLVMGANEIRLLDKNSNTLVKIRYKNGKYKMDAYGSREYTKDVILDAMYDWLVEVGL